MESELLVSLKARRDAMKEYILNDDFQLEVRILDKQIEALEMYLKKTKTMDDYYDDIDSCDEKDIR